MSPAAVAVPPDPSHATASTPLPESAWVASVLSTGALVATLVEAALVSVEVSVDCPALVVTADSADVSSSPPPIGTHALIARALAAKLKPYLHPVPGLFIQSSQDSGRSRSDQR